MIGFLLAHILLTLDQILNQFLMIWVLDMEALYPLHFRLLHFRKSLTENGFYTVSAGGTGFGLENPLSYVYITDNLNVINNMVADANFAIQLPYNLTFKSQIGIILSGNRFNSI